MYVFKTENKYVMKHCLISARVWTHGQTAGRVLERRDLQGQISLAEPSTFWASEVSSQQQALKNRENLTDSKQLPGGMNQQI